MLAELYFRNSGVGTLGQSVDKERWIRFNNPLEIYSTNQPDEVPQLLEQIRSATLDGYWAAGFIGYEAASGLDPAFRVHQGLDDMPLLWFAIFDQLEPVVEPRPNQDGEPDIGHPEFGAWEASVTRDEYHEHVGRIREYIGKGDTYQVNYCYPLSAGFKGDPLSGFIDLYRVQPTNYAAYLDTGRQYILSLSPELFFHQNNHDVITRPMKGTAPRGRWLEEDKENIRRLKLNPKDRAENLMIVDLLRNDLGRIALTGSVEVTSLYEVEKYRTILQMTSSIQAKTDCHPVDTLKAMFPSGSVTGAPKIRTMEIIREQESGPRGVYTGAIGWFGPDSRARFNVAIRTITIQYPEGCNSPKQALFGVGSGITWYSNPADEFDETCAKARILSRQPEDLSLLETILWEPRQGYFLLDLHLDRLSSSAALLDFKFNYEKIIRRLHKAKENFASCDIRVRLVLDRDGSIKLEYSPLTGTVGSSCPDDESHPPLHVGLAKTPVDSWNPFLYHKTANRADYDMALDECRGLDDVILWNERGEVTETSRANLVVDTDSGLITPARGCGLLAGTFRHHLLKEGSIGEGVIDIKTLASAHRFWLVNSVRRWVRAKLIDQTDAWKDRHQSGSSEPSQGKNGCRAHAV